MTNVDKEMIIRDLGIFELRGLARQLGVHSPTTRKREDLIESILKIMQEGNGPENSGKRKGRPFKQLSSIKDILNTVIEEENPYEEMSFDYIMNFAQVAAEFSTVVDAKGPTKRFEGYARVNNGKISFIDTNENSWVFVDDNAKYSELIKNGDQIVVNGCSTSAKNQ